MIQVVLKQNKNKKMPNAYGLYYAYPVVNETYDLDKLAEHMSSHNTPFSKGAIKGMLTDAVNCIRELNLQGIAVKINDLAIFSLGIKNKMGAKSIAEWSAAKNIAGVKSRARATGNLISASLNLDATIKRVDKGVTVTGGGSNGGGSNPSGGSSTGDNTSGGTDKGNTGTTGGNSGTTGGDSTDVTI
ncbi:DNA-binding protein [Segatella copri]|uniref:HU family DNA-binding protein n=1 Tax=Segatella copri TaxID=165179 RepID=UPI001C465CAA|nr:DNA-binding protein [Segatella copri]WOZ85032.1 DNA-binding protein [Segatella copri]